VEIRSLPVEALGNVGHRPPVPEIGEAVAVHPPCHLDAVVGAVDRERPRPGGRPGTRLQDEVVSGGRGPAAEAGARPGPARTQASPPTTGPGAPARSGGSGRVAST